MDICPFCGKAFKRLKSHLPHCKMARAKEEPPATEHAQKNPAVTNKSFLSGGEMISEVKGGDNRKQVPGTKKQRQHDHSISLYHKAEAKKSKILLGDRVTSPEPNSVENNQERLKHDQTEGKTHVTLPKEDQSKRFSKKGLAAPAVSGSHEIVTSVEGSQIQVIGAQTPVTQGRSQKLEPLKKPQLDQTASLSLRSKPVEGEVSEPPRAKLEPFRKPLIDQTASLSLRSKPVEGEVLEPPGVKVEPFRKPQLDQTASLSLRSKPVEGEVSEPPRTKLEPFRKPQLDQMASLSLRSKPVEGEVLEPPGIKIEAFRKPQPDQARSLSRGIKPVDVEPIHVEVSESSSSKLEPFRKPQLNHSIPLSHRNKLVEAEVFEPLTPKLEPSRRPQHNLATSLSHKDKLVEGEPIHLAVSESSTPFTQALPGGAEPPEKALPGSVTVTRPKHLNHKQEAEASGEGSPWYRQVSKGVERGANHFLRMDPLDQSSGHSGGDKREDDRSYWPTVSDSLKLEVGLVHGEGAATPALFTQAPSGRAESLKPSSEQNVTVMWSNHQMEREEGLINKVEGNGGEGTPTYEGSREAEFGVEGEDRLKVATEDHLNRERFPKLTDQQLEIGSPFPLSTKVSAPFGSSGHVLQGVLQGVPGAVLEEVQGMTPAQALERAKKNMENKLSRRPCVLGLQWIPQLYSNYTQLKIVPGKPDQSEMDWRMGWTVTAGEPSSDRGEAAPLAWRRLLDVRMRELPSWLSLRRIPELGRSAWSRHYSKYKGVKKGGAGGLATLLAAFCVLTYCWSFPRIRQDRWRK